MRRKIAKLVVGGGVLAAALSIAMPAYAATWTVSGGTSWTAALSSGTTATLTDTTSSTSFQCTVSTAAGTIKNGTGLSGTALGSITSSTFGNSTHKCTGPLGSTGTAAQKAGTTENVDAISYSGGVTTGDVSNIDVILSISDLLGSCTAEVTGTANATYTNTGTLLSFTNAGTLTVKSATGTGCAGVIKAGDHASYSTGTAGHGYVVSDSPGPLKITSP